ncbi:helix-turn-helix domain-containing protein [Enterococcus lactis]
MKIILMQEPCIAKLADQLFLSTASIRRIIMFLNESFQKRGFLFRIHTTPYVHIQGEERQIHFFTAVYLRRSIHRINFLIPKYCLQLSNDT